MHNTMASALRDSFATVCLVVVAGCNTPSPSPGSAANTPPTDTPSPVDEAPAALQQTTTRQPACTLAWRAHGHTTQREAKAFAATCLKASDGAVDQRLNAASVLSKLTPLIPTSHELTDFAPRDIADFCPGYANQDASGRAAFWRVLLAAVVRPESNYRTATAYWEGGRQQQYSLGLLQLSYNDNAGYHCGFTTEAEVTNPDRNLACGVRILSKLVGRAKRIGGDAAHNASGAAAYWSTLRSSSAARSEIINITTSIRECK